MSQIIRSHIPRALGLLLLAALATGCSKDRGTSFDPAVVDAFLRIPYDELRNLAARFGVALQEE